MPRRLPAHAPFVAGFLWLSALWAGANPFEPENDQAILERLPLTIRGHARGLATRDLSTQTDSTQAAISLARGYIQDYRSESDPRFLGYAQAVLGPWWNLDAAPSELIVLRATIKQSTHQFDLALKDLDIALKEDPLNAQAWLTRATVLQVQGRYDEAKKACAPLLRLAPPQIAIAAMASVASLNGDASRSYALLTSVLARTPSIPVD